jgi:hypothetical protein
MIAFNTLILLDTIEIFVYLDLARDMGILTIGAPDLLNRVQRNSILLHVVPCLFLNRGPDNTHRVLPAYLTSIKASIAE